MQNTSKRSESVIPSLVSAETVHFQWQFLRPKYWHLWLGVGLLWLTTQLLPYKWQLSLGRKLGTLLMRVVPSRRKIVQRKGLG